jgi:DNA-binding XRE family transcriptional regulator
MRCRLLEVAGHQNENGKLVFNWNVSEMCRAIGISRSYFYKIVRSETMPSVSIALSICNYLNARAWSIGSTRKYTIEKLWK